MARKQLLFANKTAKMSGINVFPHLRGFEHGSGTGMAKTCKVCKRSYPDNMAECPHCAKAIEVLEVSEMADEDMVELDEPGTYARERAATPADSAVDLGSHEHAAKSPSGAASGADAGDSSL